MYKQVYDPVADSLGWSTLFAVLPLLTLFILLGGLKLKAQWAALLSLLVAIIVALAVYSMPLGQTLDAAAEPHLGDDRRQVGRVPRAGGIAAAIAVGEPEIAGRLELGDEAVHPLARDHADPAGRRHPQWRPRAPGAPGPGGRTAGAR